LRFSRPLKFPENFCYAVKKAPGAVVFTLKRRPGGLGENSVAGDGANDFAGE
jgi:hypothetical protein